MSVFDSLLNTVWRTARNEEDFLTTFARLTSDKQRAQTVLALPQLEVFRVTDGFSGKCETRAEDLRLLGDKLYQETAASAADSAEADAVVPEQALALYTSAIKLAPHESGILARSYMGRSQVLLRMGYTDLALEDARRALGFQLPQQDAIKILSVAATCHQQNGAWNQAEETLQQALDKLRNSQLENDVKAAVTGEIISQLKKVGQSKQQSVSKKKSRKKTGTKTPEPRPGGVDLPELTYGKNTDIPAASAALRLCQSPEKGRYMEATRDIKLGSVLIVEEPYAWALSREAMVEHCLRCCCLVVAPVPCTQCSTVSYCSEECRDVEWQNYHRYECSILNHLINSEELTKMALLVYRIVITKYVQENKFSQNSTNANEKQERVDDRKQPEKCSTAQHEDREDPDNDTVAIPFLSHDYTSVYGQVTNSKTRTPADLLKRATSAAFLMRCLHHVAPEINELTTTTMLLRHLQSCSCNAYQITEQIVPNDEVRNATENELGGGVYPTISLCNHSCNPNVVRHSKGRICIVRTIKSIKKGDEILDNYGAHFLSNNVEERQKQLTTQYFFRCICEACSNNWPTVDKLDSKITDYKCIYCFVRIGTNVNNLKSCPHCKKKCDFGKIMKRIQVLSKEYKKALEYLLQKRLHECLRTCIEYGEVMDWIVAHPNKPFVSCQQAITLCWSLLGNINNRLK